MRSLRSQYIQIIILSLLFVFLEGVAYAMGIKHKPLNYNLLLITIDTLRADHLGCYGYKLIETPNIDKLASEGVLFSQAITPAPITLPSHSSIMTGLYPVQHGVQNNGNFFLDKDVVTLAEVMKEHGYMTGACIGSFVLDSVFGLDQGFDFYNDNFNPGKKRRYFLYNERNAGEVNKVAIQWLERQEDNKFFLWIHYFDPHSPYFPPFPYNLNYRNRLYDGEIAYVDTCLGELFNRMNEMELTDKTLIILVADHGEGLGDHNELTHAVFIYDSTIHVPLIINYPGLKEKGRTVSAMVSTIDIMPTVLDILGFKPINGLAGKSILPLIYGKARDIHTQILCESLCPKLNFGWSSLHGVRTPEWKFIQAPVPELYHLSEDPGEGKNLLQQGRGDHVRWKSTLETLKQKYPPFIKTSSSTQIDPETEQRLRSLGYVWTRPRDEAAKIKAGPDPKDKIHIMNYMDDGMGYLLLGLYDKAIEEYTKIIKEDPENMAGYFNLASAYEEKGELDQAEVFFKKVLEIDPKHCDVYNHLGLIHYHREEWDKALKEFQISLELFEYAETYYNASLVWQKKGMIKEAIEAIKRSLELDPDYADAWNHLGNLYLARNDNQEAAQQFEKALELDPRHVTAHNNLGLVFSQRGQIEDAIKEFNKAIEVDPNSAEAHNNLGSLYMGQGKYDQAMNELKKAIGIRPEYKNAIINLGMLYVKLNDLQNGEVLFRKIIDEIDKNFTEAYSQLGYLYLLKQDFNKAIFSFNEMLRLQPGDSKAYYYLGKAYRGLGQTEAAIKAWQKALDFQPGLAGAHLDLGNIYFEMGDFQSAQQEWQLAFLGKPVDILTHLSNMGMVYFQSEQYRYAIAAWQKACELKPNDLNLHYNLAVVFFKQGRYRAADSQLKECLRIQPDYQNAYALQEQIKLIGEQK